MDNRGIDQDPGWINRQLRELRQAIEALRSERRGAATEITDGDLTLRNGGSIIVHDKGSVVATHQDGTHGAWFGPTYSNTGEVQDIGFTLRDTDGLSNLFRAAKNAVLGSIFHVYADSVIITHRTTGAEIGMDANKLYLRGGTNPVEMTISATTSASPNVVADSLTDKVLRSTSSRRYKQDIADHDIDPTAVLKMRVRTWRDRAEVDKDAGTTQRYIGFIAEELHDLGLTEFVSYDEQGRPDAVAYDRIPVALLIALRWLTKQVRDERARTDALEAKVATQQQQIADLIARVTALEASASKTATTTRST